MKKNKLKIKKFSTNQMGRNQMITISGGNDSGPIGGPIGDIGGGPYNNGGSGGGTMPGEQTMPPLTVFVPGSGTTSPKPTNT